MAETKSEEKKVKGVEAYDSNIERDMMMMML